MAPALNAEITQAPTAPASGTSSQQPSLLETVTVLANDPIPNIRFNVAKAFEVLATVLADQPGGNDLVRDTIIPGLMKLKDDDDADVRYFAGKALEVSRGTHCLPLVLYKYVSTWFPATHACPDRKPAS